ncbi:protein FAM214A isoform X2 [Nematostella vectensis]|uniref:protein FAM214A isoform X2 n=1 Tax=Nematostella vectensis TaxID=45351 RepID=UPI002076E6A0|nr:protein FAM214A isoform X2 [Nematostella vectensis]
MKPLEAYDFDGEMECEMQPKDFFVNVGMLVIEGRTPELSKKGRVEGKHCPSITGMVTHQCDKIPQCQEALARRKRMEYLWQRDKCFTIDVLLSQINDPGESDVLIEQWTVEVVGSFSGSHLTSCSMLMQAVRSNIHFSQLSAWFSLSKGTQPSNIKYVIHPSSETSSPSFLRDPISHVFPLASLPGHSAVCVMVKSFPRCDVTEILAEVQSRLLGLSVSNGTSQAANGRLSSHVANGRSPLRKKIRNQCEEASTEQKNFQKGTKRTELFSDSACSIGTSLQHIDSRNGFSNLSSRLSELDETVSRIGNSLEPANGPSLNGSREKLRDPIANDGHDLPHGNNLAMVLDEKSRSLSEEGIPCKDLRRISNGSNNFTIKTIKCATSEKQQTNRQCTSRQGGSQNARDVDIHAVKQPIDRTPLRRSVGLPIGACSEPVFNKKTGLPISSSPAPLRRSTTELDDDSANFSSGLSCSVDYRELAKILSRSAPASTTQSLLGNFEESVLNGRMDPEGAVDGFTAELSASGMFCPAHIRLPVNAYFYRLSDDDAPSPYMGYIRLDEGPIAKKGYHIPKKGTIQLTVFNPNETVVKVFVAVYDVSDMPPLTQTFLRQKTFSVRKGHSLFDPEVQPTLQYLLHLRFASSRSGRIYLHTDIRVIFARHPPDLGNMYYLHTATDGPTDPKYTSRPRPR